MSLQLYLNHKNRAVDPQLTAISGYNPRIPLAVIDKISQLNLEKGARSPMALVLLGSYDTCPPAIFNASIFSQLAKLSDTHRVFIQTLSEKRQIQLMISSAKVAGKVNTLFFVTHGTKNGILILKNSEYSTEDIDENHFKDLPEDSEVFVTGCHSGQKFAPALAKKINRTVHGNTGMASFASCIYFCKKHRALEITHTTNFDIFVTFENAEFPVTNYTIFKPDESVTYPCDPYLEKIPELIKTMTIYFKKWHQSADCYSYMGLLYEFIKDFKTAVQHYYRGALLNDTTSHSSFGRYFEVGVECIKNIRQAFLWYQSAAMLGDLRAAQRLQGLIDSCVPAIILPLPALVLSSATRSSSSSAYLPLPTTAMPSASSSSAYLPLPTTAMPSASSSLAPYYANPSCSFSSPSYLLPPLPLLPSESHSIGQKRKLPEQGEPADQQQHKRIRLEEEDLEGNSA